MSTTPDLVRRSFLEPDPLLVERLRLVASLRAIAARRHLVEGYGVPAEAVYHRPLLATITYRLAAQLLGSSPGTISRQAKALGIPYPLTPDDVSRLGFYLYGPYSGMPRFVQGDDGHFWKVPGA